MLDARTAKTLIFILLTLISLSAKVSAQPKDCGPDQADILDRFNYVYKEVWNKDFPAENNSSPRPPSTPVTRASETFPIVRTNTTLDPRSTGSYYYDMQSSRDLSSRERRQADSYRQSVVDLRKTPVTFNTPGIGTPQKQEISQILDRLGVSYDRNNFSIPAPRAASNTNNNRISIEDRVREIVHNTMKGPITDITYQMDVLRDRITALENATKNEKDPQWRKRSRMNSGGGERNERMLASIPNAIPPEKAAANPLDLDEIVNKALYIRDGAHWKKSQSLSEKESRDPISKNSIAKDIFKSIAIGDGTEIRVLELVNKKDEVVGIKIFIYRPDKRTWVPVFYKPDPQTQHFVRQQSYHGDRLPYACLNCHGGSLRKMSPQVDLSNWPKTSKK